MKLLTQEGAIAGTRSEDLTNKFSILHWFIKSGGVRTREWYIMRFQAIFIIGMGGADAGSAPQHNKVCQRVGYTATAVQFTIEVRNRTHAALLTRYHNWYRYSTDACVDQ